VVDPDDSIVGGASSARLQALEQFNEKMRDSLRVGPLVWDKATPNLRALTVNSCLRRQQDSLEGAVSLGKAGHGHLAVALIRAFLEERLWIGFLARMTSTEANVLLLAMGRWDAIRALAAQRDYIGDQVMTLDLWYPPGFVDAQVSELRVIKEELRELRNVWGWQGTLPSTAWIADQVSLRDEYEYLHSATSRAVHFSAGEVLRRGWGTPGGTLVTAKSEFREHLAEFAYDQLWRQHLGTLVEAADHLHESAITTPDNFFSDDSRGELLAELDTLGRVPLVHAHEWNLTPPPSGTRMAWAAVMLRDQADNSDNS
jgi:hypothetical protein